MKVIQSFVTGLILLSSCIPLAGMESEFTEEILTAKQARKHIGEIRTVCGTVRSTSTLQVRGRPTLLNFGKAWPDQDLTVYIWVNVHEQLDAKAERLPGNDVCVMGEIDRSGGKPLIHVTLAEQIVRANILD